MLLTVTYGVMVVDVADDGVSAMAVTPRGWCVERQSDTTWLRSSAASGSLPQALPPGTVVHVVADRIAELGAEDDEAFLTIEELNLPGEPLCVNTAPPANAALPAVSGITVNTVHGNERSIAAVVERFKPQVESMEGAAFMYACLIHGVPFAQVRAVSNVVETAEPRRVEDGRRDRQPRRDGARASSITYEAVPRLFSLSERLLHVRRDRQPADRSRRPGVLGAPGRRRSAEQGGVRRRDRRHQAELSRLRVLRRRLRAARRRQRARAQLRTAADLEAADLQRRGRGGALRIAIPGKYTTANFLLGLAFPAGARQDRAVFSDIERRVLDGEFDAGLIIHENRFTYEAKGLKKIIDLGEFWESETGAPIPLGGIVIKRSLPDEVKHAVNRVLRRSVEYAFAHRDGQPAVRARARAGDERRGDVQAHRPVRERVLDRSRRGGGARWRLLFERAARERHHPGCDGRPVSSLTLRCSARAS